jgi:alpha-beta hydrolase superfamily lysophospholipase
MPKVTVPTILVHPTADTEIRVRQAQEIMANAGAADVTYVEMKGAPHYLEGHRRPRRNHTAQPRSSAPLAPQPAEHLREEAKRETPWHKKRSSARRSA